MSGRSAVVPLLLAALATGACREAAPPAGGASAADNADVAASASDASDSAGSPTAAPLSLQRRVGVAQRARDGSYCLAIANPDLSPGAPVLLATLYPPVRVDTAAIEAPREAACTEPGDEWGHAMIESAAFYRLRLAAGAEPMDPNIAVVAPVRLETEGDSVIVGDVDGDGRQERFESCASHEGIHLSLTAGAERRWHAYFYVPYELEPNCEE